MRYRNAIAFIIYVILHVYVLWNVYQADQLTPRVINVTVVRPCLK